jgi:hypothetical protein
MTAKEAYTQAKQLAQSGQYEAALQALIGYDHPKVEALRQQIREAMAAKNAKPSVVTKEAVAAGIKLEKQESFKFGCVVVLVVMALMFLCIMAISFQANM